MWPVKVDVDVLAMAVVLARRALVAAAVMLVASDKAARLERATVETRIVVAAIVHRIQGGVQAYAAK